MSKLIAHRGWSIGKGDGWIENTLSAFDKSINCRDYKIGGIEIDIRQDITTGEIVLTHDPLVENTHYTTLAEAVHYAKEQNWQLLLELKECTPELFNKVIKIVQSQNMQDKTIIFGFESVMRKVNWKANRSIKLGIVAEYPWQIKKTVEQYKPDILVLGWDPERAWTRLAFKIYWSIFSLHKMARKYNVKLFSGVASSKRDITWLQNHKIDYYSADLAEI